MTQVAAQQLGPWRSMENVVHAVQGLYYSEEGGEAGVTEVAAHQLWTEPGWSDPVWRDVVPHFHHMSERELARFNAAGAPGCAAWPCARRL